MARAAIAVPVAFAYSDDEPRDDHGRWTSGGSGDASPATEAAQHVASTYRTAAGGAGGALTGGPQRDPAEMAAAFAEAENAQRDKLGAGSPEASAVDRYTNSPGGSEGMNGELQSGNISRYAEQIANMDSAMGKAGQTTAGPVTLYRSLAPSEADAVASWARGDLVTENGFASTAASAQLADTMTRPGGVSMAINVPAGTSYLLGDPLATEVILDRGTTFRVGSMESMGDHTRVTVDVVR